MNMKLDPVLGGNSPKAVEFPLHWIPAGDLFFSQRMFGKHWWNLPLAAVLGECLRK